MACIRIPDCMIRNKSNFFIYPLKFAFLCFFISHPNPLFAEQKNTPTISATSHEVILKNITEQPHWMELWEKARSAVKNGDKQNAILRYQELFAEKPLIEEALREYVVVLMDIEQWQEAGKVNQKLLEIDSTSLDYQLYGGRIALMQKRYERAAKYLSQVYNMAPDGPFSLEALKGQITALQNMGRKELAHPLMEQLCLLAPDEETFLRQLARLSKDLGYDAKASVYYKTLITEFAGTDLDYLESEPLFQAEGDIEMSLKCWLGYLTYHPFYIPFHKKLSTYYLENNLEHKALEHLLILIAHGEDSPAIFLQTGSLYLYEKGRPDKALYYYEEYRKRSPHDKQVVSEIKRIQAILANDLLVIVENEGAWNLWRDLAKVIPDRLAVYYSMAEQLEALGKENELLEVLQIIQTHNPDDQKIIFKLAELHFNFGDTTASRTTLNSLNLQEKRGKKYFFLRARIAEKNSDYTEALDFYKQYLLQITEDYSLVMKCLKLSGDVGLVNKLNYFYELLPLKSEQFAIYKQGNLLYGEALILNNLYSQARKFYQDFRKNTELNYEERSIVAGQLIRILASEEKYFETEQQLRASLIETTATLQKLTIIRQLIQTNLSQKDWHNAWKWYELLVTASHSLLPDDLNADYDLFIDKIRILKESGQLEVAIEMAEDFLYEHDSSCSDIADHCYSLRSALAESYYLNEDFPEAKAILHNLISIYPDDMDLKILDQVTSKKLNKTVLVLPILNYLKHAVTYRKYGEYHTALELCRKFLVQYPDSLRARVMHAKLLEDIGDDFIPLAFFKKLALEYPDEEYFKQNILKKEFKNAKFRNLIEELAPEWKPVRSAESTISVRKVVPDIKSLPINQRLLLARAFWADNRREDALLLYRSLLIPAVDHEFSELLNANKIQLHLPPPEKSFLNTITFTNPAEPDRLDVVMSPEFTVHNLALPVVQIASKLYANYRWQQIVMRELSVREAMVDGNYYQAMKEYQDMLRPDSSPESLYDLAGIYSRLGFSGKEAALYKIIKKESPGYPDLEEAIQRNTLKRKARMMPFYEFGQKKGRDGYFDLKEKAGGLQALFFPTLEHEFLFDVRRILNESIELDDSFWRNRIEAEMKWSPIYDLDFLVSVGFDHTDNDNYENTIPYNFQVNGRVGDMASGYLGFSQDVVDDTLESLKRGIYQKEYGAGMKLDILPRLFGGGEYLFTEYSDGNHQNRYELWTSYILASEPTMLQLRYGYEFSRSAEGNMKRDYSFDSGFGPDDHPYWSPNEYWQHLFTASFEHQLAENILGRGAPSYYTLEYSFGYEIGGYDNHEVKAQIFLEMSRHLLLNSSFEIIRGANVEETSILCSVIYRW